MNIADAKQVLKDSGFKAKEIAAFSKRQIHGKAKGLLDGQTIDGHKYVPPTIYTFWQRVAFWAGILVIILIVLRCFGITPTDIGNFCKSMAWGVGFMILFAVFGKDINGDL